MEAINSSVLEKVSNERKTNELLLCLNEEKRVEILERLLDIGIFNKLYPKLLVNQANINKVKDIQKILPKEKYDIILICLLILFENANVEDLKSIFELIKLKKEYKKRIMQYIKNKNNTIEFINSLLKGGK